jgi:hypothetical protein
VVQAWQLGSICHTDRTTSSAHTPASPPHASFFPPAPCIPQAKIKEELQADTVVVSDVYGDGRHVSINVVSNAFEGEHARADGQSHYAACGVQSY